jgi:hypothetical protein
MDYYSKKKVSHFASIDCTFPKRMRLGSRYNMLADSLQLIKFVFGNFLESVEANNFF